MAKRQVLEISGDSTYTFQQFVLEAINRINTLSGGEGSSYNTMAHESCINDLWCSIPEKKKEKFLDDWDECVKDYDPYKRGLSPEEKQKQTISRICAKRQILTECLNAMRFLFEGGDSVVREVFDMGE